VLEVVGSSVELPVSAVEAPVSVLELSVLVPEVSPGAVEVTSLDPVVVEALLPDEQPATRPASTTSTSMVTTSRLLFMSLPLCR
jgi:hypothetical protein